MTAAVAGLLIDENLSPELADLAISRGFHSIAVARMWRLRGRGDHIIARYALDRELILVTNNLVDFERIYDDREFHPGLIFITAIGPKLMKLPHQLAMFSAGMDEVEEDEPIEEVILVTASPAGRNSAKYTVERYELPDVSDAQR